MKMLKNIFNSKLRFSTRPFNSLPFKLFSSENKCEKEQCGCHPPKEEDVLMKTLKAKNYQIIECINMGKYHEAINLSTEYIQEVKNQFGDKHNFYCSAINNKAYILKVCGEYDEAKVLFEEVIEKYTDITGGKDNEKVIISMHNLATLYKDWGQLEKSLEMFKEIMQLVNVESFSNKDTHLKLNLLANIYNSAAGLYSKVKNYKEADRLFEIALNLIKTNFGENTLPYASVLNNIGISLKERGKYDESLEKYNQVLKIREELLDKDHPEVQSIKHNIRKLKDDKQLLGEGKI